jgi:ATP adenylyltransferase
LAYVSGDAAAQAETRPARQLAMLPGADPECFICRAVADDQDRQNLLVRRSPLSVVILNRFPYNNGHLLVAPLRHQGRLGELTSHEQLDLQRWITHYVAEFERLMKAEGFNVGVNLGRAAGAGLPGHLHWHVVPRWSGDTNFMPALAGVRVIPQALDALWELLHDAPSAAPAPE